MKKLLVIVLAVLMVFALVACSAPTEEPAADDAATDDAATDDAATDDAATDDAATDDMEEDTSAEYAEGLTIGYYKDAADDYYKAGYEVFKHYADEAGWEVLDVVGDGTATSQITNIENFISAGVDAVVCVQNSPDATSECLDKCNAAGIPYFAATHTPTVKDGQELAGFVGYDFVYQGYLNGKNALEKGVTKVIMIEGKLGQGTAAAQSLGFLQAYEEAGKDIGGTAEEVATNKTEGGADLQIVAWGSGEWWADPAKKLMQDYISSLGADGFDGAYVQNDEMMDGAIQAIEEAGLDPANYWLGSSNGKEKSWKWIEEGKETQDLNQTPTLEADLMFQIVNNYFLDKTTKSYVNPYTTEIVAGTDMDSLIPYDVDEYFTRLEAGVFDNSLDQDAVKELDTSVFAG